MELKRDLEKLLAGEELRYPIAGHHYLRGYRPQPGEYLELPVLCRLSEGGTTPRMIR